MFHKIREAQQGEREEGFTLIELLVVVIIIGILAAIAIPVFLNQREKARNAAANSDLRNMITAQEGYYTENDNYYGTGAEGAEALSGSGALGGDGFTNSSGVLACTETYDSGDKFVAETFHQDGTLYFYYDSAVGEIQKSSATSSPTTANADCAPAL